MSSPLPALLLLAFPAAAQAPGHRLVAPVSSTRTLLFDAAGKLVHTWPSQHKPGMSAYLLESGNLLRSFVSREDPGALSGTGGGVQELSIEGELVWEYRLDSEELLAHHDIEPLANGNVLMIAWEELTREQALAAGRDPERTREPFRPDRIVEVRPTGPRSGEIVWSWRVLDHLDEIPIDFPPQRIAGELNHINGIDHDPLSDWIAVAACFQDEVWIIERPSGELIQRFGNPRAHGAEGEQELFFPHAPRFVPQAGGPPNLLVFSNLSRPTSRVIELELAPVGGGAPRPVWSYSAPGFDSDYMASAERLPGGSTLICSSMQLRVFEVDEAGELVWEIGPGELEGYPFHATYTERTLWPERTHNALPHPTAEPLGFRVIAGSSRRGEHVFLWLDGGARLAPWPWSPPALARAVLDERGNARLRVPAAGPLRVEWLQEELCFVLRDTGPLRRVGREARLVVGSRFSPDSDAAPTTQGR